MHGKVIECKIFFFFFFKYCIFSNEYALDTPTLKSNEQIINSHGSSPTPTQQLKQTKNYQCTNTLFSLNATIN